MLRSNRLLWTVSAGLALTLIAGCGGTTKGSDAASGGGDAGSERSADPNAQLEEGLKIAFLPKEIDNPYMTVMDKGGTDAVAELKGEGKAVGPSDAQASSQVSYINTLIQQQQDAIVIAANDPNAVAPALKDAMSKDIAVVTLDSDAAKDARDLFVNQASSEEIGRSQVKLIADQIGGAGKIAIISATPNATNQNTWIEFMKDELKKPEYSKIQLLPVVYGDDDDQKSFQEAQALLRSNPDLKGIISPTTVGVAAAARYLSGSSFKGKVQLTGLGTPNQMKAYVNDGTVKSFALWNPADLGYLAAWAGAALASGKITGKQGEKFTAGKLGEYTIGADGVVVLGDPYVFTKDNVANFDF